MEMKSPYYNLSYSPWLYHPSYRRKLSELGLETKDAGIDIPALGGEGIKTSSRLSQTCVAAVDKTADSPKRRIPNARAEPHDPSSDPNDSAPVWSANSVAGSLESKVNEAEQAIFQSSPSSLKVSQMQDCLFSSPPKSKSSIRNQKPSPERDAVQQERSSSSLRSTEDNMMENESKRSTEDYDHDVSLRISSNSRLPSNDVEANTAIDCTVASFTLTLASHRSEERTERNLQARKSDDFHFQLLSPSNRVSKSLSGSSMSALSHSPMDGSLRQSRASRFASLSANLAVSENDSSFSVPWSSTNDCDILSPRSIVTSPRSTSDPPGVVQGPRPDELSTQNSTDEPPLEPFYVNVLSRPDIPRLASASTIGLSEDEDIASCVEFSEQRFSPRMTPKLSRARRILKSSSPYLSPHLRKQPPLVSPRGTTRATLGRKLPLIGSLLTSESDDDGRTFSPLVANKKYWPSCTSGDEDEEHVTDEDDELCYITSDDDCDEEQSLSNSIVSKNTFHDSASILLEEDDSEVNTCAVADLTTDDNREKAPGQLQSHPSRSSQSVEPGVSLHDSLGDFPLPGNDYDVVVFQENENEIDPDGTHDEMILADSACDQFAEDVGCMFSRRRSLLTTVKEESRRSLMIANGELPSTKSLAMPTDGRDREVDKPFSDSKQAATEGTYNLQSSKTVSDKESFSEGTDVSSGSEVTDVSSGGRVPPPCKSHESAPPARAMESSKWHWSKLTRRGRQSHSSLDQDQRRRMKLIGRRQGGR